MCLTQSMEFYRFSLDRTEWLGGQRGLHHPNYVPHTTDSARSRRRASRVQRRGRGRDTHTARATAERPCRPRWRAFGRCRSLADQRIAPETGRPRATRQGALQPWHWRRSQKTALWRPACASSFSARARHRATPCPCTEPRTFKLDNCVHIHAIDCVLAFDDPISDPVSRWFTC